MKNLRRAKKGIMAFLSVIMAAVIILPAWSIATAATREENVQKIETFLSTDAATEKLTEKSVSKEKVMGQLDSMSDTQLETLAQSANQQVGGALDDNTTFWALYGTYVIVSIVMVLILAAAA